jgi:dihydrofolate synthase/folylpolyglutamate synthase
VSKKTSDVILERIMRLHPKVIDLKLNRVEHLLKKLGNPEKKFTPSYTYSGDKW